MGIMKDRDFLTMRDFSPDEISYLLNLSAELKKKRRAGIPGTSLCGKAIVLIFEKQSTRTRCAFELAAAEEGAHATVLSNSHAGEKESLEDSAKVFSRFYDGIAFRGYAQSTVEELARHSTVPVWNALTNDYHPTQVLADLLTIQEHIDMPLSKVKLVYVGDARNNVSNSLIITAAKMGMNFTALSPPELAPPGNLFKEACEFAGKTGARIEQTADFSRGLRGASVIYTDTWISMGEEAMLATRIELLSPYRVTMDMLKKTGNENVLFLHCLPAFHDQNSTTAQMIREKYGMTEMEVSDEVFRSHHSVVFDEAENRLHTIKALMLATMLPHGSY
ncbi:MAG: ornithine carbamoyltransferase [Salinispira sp.]